MLKRNGSVFYACRGLETHGVRHPHEVRLVLKVESADYERNYFNVFQPEKRALASTSKRLIFQREKDE